MADDPLRELAADVERTHAEAGAVAPDPLAAVAQVRTRAEQQDLSQVIATDLPRRNGARARSLGAMTPEDLASLQRQVRHREIGAPTTPAGMVSGLAEPPPIAPLPEQTTPLGDRVTGDLAESAPPTFTPPGEPNRDAYEALSRRRETMRKGQSVEDWDQKMAALEERLTPTEPMEGQTPIYLRRLYKPTVDRVKEIWHLPGRVEVPSLAGEIVRKEAAYRLKWGLYGPEEAHVATFEEWASKIPPKILAQMQADGSLAANRGRQYVDADQLKTNIADELGGGLPMYGPGAAKDQERLYGLIKELTPEQLPAARGTLEKIAEVGGEIAPFLAELAVARKALGAPMAKATSRAVGLGAGVEKGLASGLAAGTVAASRGEDPVREGAFFGALGGVHRAFPGTSKAAAVARAAGTGVAFGTSTAMAGGNLEDILISGLVVPLIFHAPDLIRRPWRPRTVLNRDPETWRRWSDDPSLVKKMIFRFNTMSEQADTASPESWNRELTATAKSLGRMYEKAQKTPEAFKGEELDLLQQFVNRFSEKPAFKPPPEKLRTYELDLGPERGTRQVQAGSPEEADHVGDGIAGIEYRGNKPTSLLFTTEPVAGEGTEAYRVRVSDGRQRIITAANQGEADNMARSVFGVEVTAVAPIQPVEEAKTDLPIATADDQMGLPGEVAEPETAPPPEPPVSKPAPIMQEIMQEIMQKPAARPGIAAPPSLSDPPAGAMDKPVREYEGARYSVEGAEGQGWKVLDKGTGETVQVVGSREIADVIAREYNSIETGVSAAAPAPEPPKVPETQPTTITVPPAGSVPGYRITRWPNGVHVLRFEKKPPEEVLKRIRNQGGRWHKKSKGHLMPSTFSTSQIQGVVHGTAAPPKSIDLPTPDKSKGLSIITPARARELLAIGDNRKLIRGTLRARGYHHTAGSKNEFFEHPSGEWRYRMQPRSIRKQNRGAGGKGWFTAPQTRTVKEFAEVMRRALREVEQQAPSQKPPIERPAKERTRELAELRDYVGVLGKRIQSRTNSFGDQLSDIEVQQIETLRARAEDRFNELMKLAGRRPPPGALIVPVPPASPATKPVQQPDSLSDPIPPIGSGGATPEEPTFVPERDNPHLFAVGDRLEPRGGGPSIEVARLFYDESGIPMLEGEDGGQGYQRNFTKTARQPGQPAAPAKPPSKPAVGDPKGSTAAKETYLRGLSTIGAAGDKRIAKLRDDADRLEGKISEMRTPSDLSPTRKRLGEWEQKAKDADRLEDLATWMRGMADAIEAGELPGVLDPIATKATLEDLRREKAYPLTVRVDAGDVREAMKGQKGAPEVRELLRGIERHRRDYVIGIQDKSVADELSRLASILKKSSAGKGYKAGPSLASNMSGDIAQARRWFKMVESLGLDPWHENYELVHQVMRETLEGMVAKKAELRRGERDRAEAIRKSDQELHGQKTPGFFPTPDAVTRAALDKVGADIAGVKPIEVTHMLEPSAGRGDMAKLMRAELPDVRMTAIEVRPQLADRLRAEEIPRTTVMQADFLAWGPSLDRVPNLVVMNPPFEKGEDIDHVRHAYEILPPGGQVVAVMSSGSFARSDKKAVGFQEWLQTVPSAWEDLPEGAFKAAFKGTGVSTKLLHLVKPAVGEVTEKPLTKAVRKLTEAAGALVEVAEGKETPKPATKAEKAPERFRSALAEISEGIAKGLAAKDPGVLRSRMLSLFRRASEAGKATKYDFRATYPRPSGQEGAREINGALGHKSTPEEVAAVLDQAMGEARGVGGAMWETVKELDAGVHRDTGRKLTKTWRRARESSAKYDWDRLGDFRDEVARLFGEPAARSFEAHVWADLFALDKSSSLQKGAERDVKPDHETPAAEPAGGGEALDRADLPDPDLAETTPPSARGPAVDRLIAETDKRALAELKKWLATEDGKPWALGKKAIEHLGVGHADAAEAYAVIQGITDLDRKRNLRYPVYSESTKTGRVEVPKELVGELPPEIAKYLEVARQSYADRLQKVETGVPNAELWIIDPDKPQSKKIIAEFKKSPGRPGLGLGGKPRKPDLFKSPSPTPGLPKGRRDPLVALKAATMRAPGRYLDMDGVLVTGQGVFASDGRVIHQMINVPEGMKPSHVYKLDAKGKVVGKPIAVTKGAMAWTAQGEHGEYPSVRDPTQFFASVAPEKTFEIRDSAEVLAIAKRLLQAMDFIAGNPEARGVIAVLNPDGTLGIAAAVPKVGSAELNVQENGVVLGSVAPALLRDALRFHYDLSDGPVQVYWPEPTGEKGESPSPIRMTSAAARTVIMPVSAGDHQARVEKVMRPGIYQADLDEITAHHRLGSIERYTAAGLRPGFVHTETGKVAKSSVGTSWQLDGLPKEMLVDENRADLAVQPGFLNAAGEFFPIADAWLSAVEGMTLSELRKAAGLDAESLQPAAAPSRVGFDAEDSKHRKALGEAIEAFDAHQQALEVETVSGELSANTHPVYQKADDYLRQLIGHRPRVQGGRALIEPRGERTVAVRLLRLKLAKREASKVRGVDPELMPQVTDNMTPEDLQYLREHGPSSPVFGMGAAPNIPDQRHWNARLYDHIAQRLQHPPPGSIRAHITKVLGRGLYGYRWALTEKEWRQFEKVKGEKRWGRMVSREIRESVRAGVSERIAKAEAKRAPRPLTAPQADTFRKRYHRELEDVLRGDRSFDSLDERQKEIWRLFIRPTRYVTDYILNNEWTWPHLQAFGLKNVEEIIMIKSMGPGEYLRRLYDMEDDTFRPPVNLTELRTLNIGPRIRGGQFMPRRGDEEFTTLVDATQSPPAIQQFLDPKQAREEWERLIKGNLEEHGKSVFGKIQVLDPFNVDELERAGFLQPVRDVEQLMERTIVDSLANLQTLKLFQYLANAVAIPAEGTLPAGFKVVPDSPAFGPLRNLAIPEPTWWALFDHESVPAHPAYQAWMVYNYAFKKAKVIYSPSTWGRNILGVTTFVYLDGNNPIRTFPHLLATLKEFRTRGPNWERLVRENEINAGWSGQELEDLERYVVANVDSWPTAVMQWLEGHKDVAARSVRSLQGVSELDRKIGQLYDLPDQVVKLWAYLIKTQTQGMSHEEALRSMWMYHNYDRAGKLARWARRSAIGEPFVMFTEQTVKIYARAMRDQALRMLALFASMPLLTWLTRMNLGITDDEMDLINADPRRRSSWVDRFFQPLIPVWNEDAQPMSVDLRWTFPLGDDFRLGNATGGWELPFATGQPWLSFLFEMGANRRNWMDRAIVDPESSAFTKLWQWSVHFIDSTAPIPPLVPSLRISAGKVKAHGGALEIFQAAIGQSREGVVRAVLREVFGIRVNDPWVRRADAFKLIKEAKGTEEAERYLELMTLYNEIYRSEYDTPIKPQAVRRSLKRDRKRAENGGG